MKNIKVLAPAKINLGLEIIKKRDDGYHEVEMIMQSVNLCDKLTININNSGKLNVRSDKIFNCKPEQNTVYKAAKKFFATAGIKLNGAEIFIDKIIPQQAGLAGGSADAAATLWGLNTLFGNVLSDEKLMQIAAQIGADVPFCLMGGAAYAVGTGTELKKISPLFGCHFVIVKPLINISTASAYALFDNIKSSKTHSLKNLLNACEIGDLPGVSKNLFNRFEYFIDETEIFDLKNQMQSCGALGCLMTGSGSAVYAIFDDENLAKSCAKKFKNIYDDVFVCTPTANGPIEII